MTYRLAIGNKNGSSWSLRPWLALRHAGIDFDEINIDLRAPDAKAQILRQSPSGKVPALLVDEPAAAGFVVWDTLAMLEFLAEAHPAARLWPEHARVRAVARSVSAEMHSGFAPLRQHCPMDFLRRRPMAELPDAVATDVRRIVAIWQDARGRFGQAGPYLFGAFSAADAMYAPVCSRFRTYLPDLGTYGDRDGVAAAYVETLFAHSAMRQWGAEARAQVS